ETWGQRFIRVITTLPLSLLPGHASVLLCLFLILRNSRLSGCRTNSLAKRRAHRFQPTSSTQTPDKARQHIRIRTSRWLSRSKAAPLLRLAIKRRKQSRPAWLASPPPRRLAL